MRQFSRIVAVGSVILLAACATQKQVNLKEPMRVVGRENDVRIDAQIFAEKISSNSIINVTYELTNQRSAPVAVADIIADSTYDVESRTVIVNVGAEVPGNEILPRLVSIGSGEKKGFSLGARMPIVNLGTGGLVPYPRFLQLRVHFLGDVAPFQALVAIPEKAVHDPVLAAALFPKWVESAESVGTNAIPISWQGADSLSDIGDPSRRH